MSAAEEKAREAFESPEPQKIADLPVKDGVVPAKNERYLLSRESRET